MKVRLGIRRWTVLAGVILVMGVGCGGDDDGGDDHAGSDATVPHDGPMGDGSMGDACAVGNGGCDPLTTCTSSSSGSVTCGACPSGYTGTGAEGCVDVDECAAEPGPCSALVECANTPGGFTCGDCPEGFVDDGADGCTDIDECATDNGGCAQTCTNGEGDFECSCGEGYTLNADGRTCDDIDECETDNGGCDELVTCTNTDGGRDCGICPLGYDDELEDGTSCVDIDECAADPSPCSELVVCTNSEGGFTCGDCPMGYVDDGAGGCNDIDECETDNGSCDPLVICTNTEGSRTCGDCPSGYAGDGETGCTNIDECATGNGGCEQTCTDSDGSFSCSCGSGYALNADGFSCDDVDECATANGGCAQTCTNSVGSFMCSCGSGYALNADGLSCDDVNECATANGGCAQTCTNAPGSFTCSCGSGYALNADGFSCDDVDECATANGGCAQTCTNAPGSFMCSCGSGYALNADGFSCDDVDECETDNGGCDANATCTNTPGSRTCACDPGYVGDGLTCTFAYPHCAAILAANPTAPDGVYVISPDGTAAVSTYCDMTRSGGGWTQIYDQDWATFGSLRSGSAWLSANTSMPNTGDYSILGTLPNLGSAAGYELVYEWLEGPMPEGYMQWTQDQSPLVVGDDVGRATVSNLTSTLASTPAGCGPFAGLGLSSSTTHTYLDGDEGGCWWFAVGIHAPHNDGILAIPTYNTPNEPAGNSARRVKVWVRPAQVPTSCAEVLARSPEATSGVYTLQGRTGAYEAYCDMTTDGGGWTLVLKADGRQPTFSYDNARWTGSTTFNPTSPAFDRTEALLESYFSVAFTQVRVGMEDPIPGTVRYVTLPRAGASLSSVIAPGTHVATAIGRNAWKGLMASGSLQTNCNREGFNVRANVPAAGWARARIGIIGNQEADCGSPDSRIGIGTAGDACGQDTTISVGNAAFCTPDAGERNTRGFGYVLVR